MCVRDMLDTLKSSNLYIIGDSEKEEERKEWNHNPWEQQQQQNTTYRFKKLRKRQFKKNTQKNLPSHIGVNFWRPKTGRKSK